MTRTLPGRSASALSGLDQLVFSLAMVILSLPVCFGQDATDWEAKAGGKMSFDVASVKPFKLEPGKLPRLPTFGLGPDDAKPAGGRFFARFPLESFIQFAYKLAPFQMADALANSPKWLRTDRYEIEAEAQGNPTKDQMRLMMQSLLAERFKLAVHFEIKGLPVLALTQVKAGKLGPKLLPHSQGPPCPEYEGFRLDLSDPRKEVFPHDCVAGYTRGMPDGTTFMGSRDATMATAAYYFYAEGSGSGEIDRPLVDQTGLDGTFDFVLEYKRDKKGIPAALGQAPEAPPGAAAPSDEFGGTPFVDALRQQLGLKLVRTKAPVRTLVIDHVERPSEN